MSTHRWGPISRRLHGRRGVPRTPSRIRNPARRQGYGANAIRLQVEEARRGAEHPTQAKSQMEEVLFAPPLSQPKRHQRMFRQLKAFQGVATRSDRVAANFLAAVCIAATFSYWL
jgi:hypothetical protein